MRMLVGLAILATFTATLGGQRSAVRSPAATAIDEAPYDSEAEWYASHYAVALKDAEHRLVLEDLAGKLDALLTKEQGESFAGMWIEHEPTFVVQIRMLPDTQEAVFDYLKDENLGSLDGVINVETRQVSYEALQELQDATDRQIPEGVNSASFIDVERARIVVQVGDSKSFDEVSNLELGDRVNVEKAVLPQALAIGGQAINGCTTGFSVDEIDSFEQGISTAGHCNNTQPNAAGSWPFQDGQQHGNTDAQWHRTPNESDPNTFFTGSDVREVLTVWSRAEQTVYSSTCKYGKTTGYTCSPLQSKNYNPTDDCVDNSSDTWMLLYGGSEPMALPGDSGGPVFKNNGARGITTCGGPGNTPMVYMASNYMSNIDAKIASN